MTKQIALLICIFAAAISVAAADRPAIIPQPQTMELHDGAFRLKKSTLIETDPASSDTANFLAERLRRPTGYNFDVKSSPGSAGRHAIVLTTKDADPALGSEGYELNVTTGSVVIRAPGQAGLFYGAQTLLQLLPPEILSTNAVKKIDWTIPCARIVDRPRFQWRGLMLDVSRHFQNKQEVEKILDLMALHKLNTFHWHLVDDDGWRIEIKKYPRLTQFGAWRQGIGFGLDPKSSTAYGPDGRYGGFYTQDDIREVVACAAARHIAIVPEIEMPGHSGAALAAFPELTCSGQSHEIDRGRGEFHVGVYCAGNDESFHFLENVLTEVFQLFPGKYIHIGGDEVEKTFWKNCPKCQARMKAEGLKNEDELQSYFIKRMEKFVNANGHTLIGWSEIRKGGLAKSAVVMDWIGGGKEAAEDGHDVVMTPTGYCYLDYYQSPDHAIEPRAIGGLLPLERVYSFEPIPAGLPPEEQPHILGVQGNLWTEFVAASSHAEYMLFPRICAIAELGWSPKASRNWQDFQRRLKTDEGRLDEVGANYRYDFSSRVGQWSQLGTNLEWTVTGYVKGPGLYHVCFDYQSGKALRIASVELLENGHVVARDMHAGVAGAEPSKQIYALDLPARAKHAAYTLHVEVSADAGQSNGTVSWTPVSESLRVKPSLSRK